MPIRPERMALYPGGGITSPEWRAIRAAILTRADHRCEACGAPDRATIFRQPGSYVLADGETFDDRTGMFLGWTRGSDLLEGRFVIVVLTVAHLDHDEGNADPANLRAWCQRCHNTHDAPHRALNASRSRRRRAYGAAGDLVDRMEA